MAQCLHHEAVDHRMKRLESRMDRLEIGIFSALVAVLLAIMGVFIQIWDLPRSIQRDILHQQGGK